MGYGVWGMGYGIWNMNMGRGKSEGKKTRKQRFRKGVNL